MKILKLSGVVAGLLAVAACGGGGGSTGSDSNNVLSGVALDGYLYKANVCLDLNDNNFCDPGEPASTTDELGRYTLANVTPAQVRAHSVLVNAIPGVTIDQDQPGVPVAASYLLTAPAGSSTISPLTTLVKAEMIVNGVDAETAEANTFNKLFANASYHWSAYLKVQSLYLDYIKNPDPALQRIAAALINRRIDASLFDPDLPIFEALAKVYFTDFASSVVEYVAPNIDAIQAAATPDAARTIVETAMSSGIAELREGVSELRDLGSRWYGLRTLVASAPSAGVKTFTVQERYAIQQPAFVQQAPAPTEYWELSGFGWSPVDSAVTDRFPAWTLTGGEYGTAGAMLSVSRLTLTGQGLDSVGLEGFDGSQTFPADSIAYRLKTLTRTPRYILSGNPLSGADQGPVAGLDELLAAFSSSASPTWVNFLQSRTGLLLTFTPTSASAGTLSFRDPDEPYKVALTGGTYSIQQFGEERLLILNGIPEAVFFAVARTNPEALVDYRNGVRPFFAAGPDGKVREGVFTPRSVVDWPTPLLNRTALNALLQSLSLCQLSETYENVACPN
jgi:hypothetical protein